MSDWTVDTLKEYFEALFSAEGDATQIAMTAAQTAVDKAERLAAERAENQDKLASERSHQQNEWRSTLGDLSATKVSRDEYDIAHKVLQEKITAISARLDLGQGHDTGTRATLYGIAAAIASVVAVVSIIIQLSH